MLHYIRIEKKNYVCQKPSVVFSDIRILGCSKLKANQMQVSGIFPFLFAHRRQDVLCDHPWRAGGVPHFFSGAYLQDLQAAVMKFHGWIDLIKVECSAQEPQLSLA